MSALKDDWVDLLEFFQQASTKLKELKSRPAQLNQVALRAFLKDMTKFHNERRVIGEKALEYTISSYLINSKHNIFYNQRFNGGDCTWLMMNYTLLFENSTKAYKNEREEVK